MARCGRAATTGFCARWPAADRLLARLDLRPTDRATAELATALATRYGLKAADAIHLATAVAIGADRFITSDKRDFPAAMTEIAVTYPADLPDGTS